jgi:thiol-disulfide isomerase/thioredoxin
MRIKIITIFMVAMALVSCKNEPKDYATLSGKLTHKNSDSVTIRGTSYSKTIPVNEDGTFKDTLKIETGLYSLFDGVEYASLFLKNGFELHLELDTKRFDQSLEFSGKGAEHSNFLAEKIRLNEGLFDLDQLISLDSVALESELTGIKNQLVNFYETNNNVDSSIINAGPKSIDRTINSYKRYISNINEVKRQLPKGMDSPVFEAYENFNGEKTSLSDLKGKFVYVDIWATWCGPCKVEIPHLKSLEKKYDDRNIAFVSISVDSPKRSGSWEKAREKWKTMVTEEAMGGVQLFAPEGPKSQFVEDYINIGIPRFILIDPEGKIVSAVAPRPSSDELINLFEEQNI